MAEGVPVLSSLDVYGEAGFATALIKAVDGVQVADGRLDLELVAILESPMINGIEVVAAAPPNQAPVAAFDATPASGEAPLLVTFDASASYDPDDDPMYYSWDFGDGSVGSGVTAGHEYESEGSFTVVLTVGDPDGASDVATGSIAVEAANQQPVAAFSATPASGAAPLAVALDASGSNDPDGDPLFYAWDFGDGSVGSGVTASHEYASQGSFSVVLTVSDPDGASDTESHAVQVTAPPESEPEMVFYFSLGYDGAVGDSRLRVANEDIVAFDGTDFRIYFDGSDVGLGGLRLNAFAVLNEREILMSFSAASSVPGIPVTVDDSDIVKFVSRSPGETTAGYFEMYLDGSDVGLSRSAEDIDAIELLPDGRLLISTVGGFGVSGLYGRDEDVLDVSRRSSSAATLEVAGHGTWTAAT